MKPFFTFLILPLFIILGGCSDSNGGLKAADGDKSKEMQAAIAAERIGDFDEAIRLYNETIDNYKDASLANLQLALLLHEYKKDYLGAIFYYRRYIETAKERKVRDFSIVSNRIEKVEQLLSAKYVSDIASSYPSEAVALRKEYNTLDKKVTKLENEKKGLLASNETLRAEIVRLNNKIDQQLLWIKRIQASPDGGISSNGRVGSVTVTDADGNSKVLQTYEVQAGDSLSKIAEYAYGDRTLWPRIRDANPDKIKDERVKVGDILIIP